MKLTIDQKSKLKEAMKFAPKRQILIFLLWSIFHKRKSNMLIRCVDDGMVWYVAYRISKTW